MRNYEQIDTIKRKYGEPIFRCGLDYLFQKGKENVPEIDIEEVRKQCEAKEKETKGMYFMTVDFQVKIVECSKELANIEMWNLLAYVKDKIGIDGCIDIDDVIEAVQDIQFDYNRLSVDGKYQMDKLKVICGLLDEEEMELRY